MLQFAGQVMMFFIVGLIVGYFFKCNRSTVLHAPSSTSVKQKIIKKNNKCYKLEPQIKICPIKWLD